MRIKRVEIKIRGRMLVAKWVDHCPSDETGRRAGFKIQWGQPRVGSTPTSGTITSLFPILLDQKNLGITAFLCQVVSGLIRPSAIDWMTFCVKADLGH